MAASRTNEKQSGKNSPVPCPFLPIAGESMSYRHLRTHNPHVPESAQAFFTAACRYANYLWMQNLPARAILALCRAIYVDPRLLDRKTRQPYAAYVWMLQHAHGDSFLGNPRFSFARQATRVPDSEHLKSRRAWALWYLTRDTRPELPADPAVFENPPDIETLAAYLNRHGLRGEGDCLRDCLAGTP
jgi:hypothetical protein